MNSSKSILTSVALAMSLMACDQQTTEALREDSIGWEMVDHLEKINKDLTTSNENWMNIIQGYKLNIQLREDMDHLKDQRLKIYEKQIESLQNSVKIYQQKVSRLQDQVWVYERWFDLHEPQKNQIDSTFTYSTF